MGVGAPCVSEIVKGQIYLGNLSAAHSTEQKTSLGITHLLSVCPDYGPSTGPTHLVIPVDDSEYADLLIHLPKACAFIDDALRAGGRVLVHCRMGVSRSATVVAAYLMQSRTIPPTAALALIQKRRPQIHPNYGFLTQLDAFARCAYSPAPDNQAYRSWKRRQEQDVSAFLGRVGDTVGVGGEEVFLSSDFPEDPNQASSLLLDLGITHLVSISPASEGCFSPSLSSALSLSSASLVPSSSSSARRHHISLPSSNSSNTPSSSSSSTTTSTSSASSIHDPALLLALPAACAFIQHAVREEGGRVLVHSELESRAGVVVCAGLMCMKKKMPGEVVAILQDALPLFNPTQTFRAHLELFHACGHAPSIEHLGVQAWIGGCSVLEVGKVMEGAVREKSAGETEDSSTVVAQSPRTTKRTSTSSSTSVSPPPPAGMAPHPPSAPPAYTQPNHIVDHEKDLLHTAAHLLSETGLDMGAFGEALAAIQGEARRREGRGVNLGEVRWEDNGREREENLKVLPEGIVCLGG